MIHILAKVKVADQDGFLAVFTTEGLQARRSHGCQGATVLRGNDPNELTILFRWSSREDFHEFRADETVKATMTRSGIMGPPAFTELDLVAELPA